jgi:hypothetical protein
MRGITQMAYFLLIHPSAWKRNSANFACIGFSEVAADLASHHTNRVT